MRGGRWLLGFALAAMAALAYFAYRGKSPRPGATEVDLSPEQEVEMLQQPTPDVELQFGGLDADPAVQQSVKAVGERVVSQSVAASLPYEFQFYVLADTRTINAFILPGGPVFITRALLSRLKNEAQLAGVLGHELGHVLEHQSNPTRDSEREADELGVQLMSEAGYDPRALIGVVTILAGTTTRGRVLEFLPEYPDPGNRALRIQDEIARLFPDGVPGSLTLGESLVAWPEPGAIPPT